MGRPAPEPNNNGKTQGGGRVRTLGQLRDYVLKNHYAVHARRSLDWAERNLRLCLEFLGEETPVADVDEETLDRLAEHFRKEGNSDATVNRKLAALSKALTIAQQKLRIIDRKPAVPLTREHQGRIRFLTRDEEVAMLNLAPAGWGQQTSTTVIAFAIDSGGSDAGRYCRPKVGGTSTPPYGGRSGRTRRDQPISNVPLTKRAREII